MMIWLTAVFWAIIMFWSYLILVLNPPDLGGTIGFLIFVAFIVYIWKKGHRNNSEKKQF